MKLAHIGLSTDNLEKTVSWYKDLFGFEETKRFEKKEFEIKACVITNGEFILEVIEPYNLKKNVHYPKTLVEALQNQGLNHIAVNVSDVKQTFEKLSDLKIRLLTELIDGRFFFCFDPDGMLVEVRQG